MEHGSISKQILSWPASNALRKPTEDRFAAGAAFAEGMIVPVEEATVPLLDWGFLRSDACQETVSVWNGRFFRLDDHLDRFFRSITRLRLDTGDLTRAQVRHVMHRLVVSCGYDRAYVQILMTRGRPPIGSRDIRQCVSRFRAFCVPYVWIADEAAQQRGIALHLSDRVRVPSASVDPMVKHYHWLDFQMALFDAHDSGSDTAVLVDGSGHVAEGPGFNIFAVLDGVLVTPESGVLDGMTRRTVIELAAELGLSVQERPLAANELREADEAFLTSTAGGVMPVRMIDDMPLPKAAPGEVTAQIHMAYWALRSDDVLNEAVDFQLSRK